MGSRRRGGAETATLYPFRQYEKSTESRIRSAGMLAAVTEGRVQAGDTFAGVLETEDPIFALPSRPFSTAMRFSSPVRGLELADIGADHHVI
jgi:hypothetical protein